MSGILSSFVSHVLNLFKRKEEQRLSRRDVSSFPVPLRRCNSVIEDRRIKDVFSNGTPYCNVWTIPSNSNWHFDNPLQSSDDEDSGVFHTPGTDRRDFSNRECPSCKGDMNGHHHVLAFCQKHIPVRGRDPDRTENRPKRSRSFDSREASSRNTDWHEKFNSLRTDKEEALEISRLESEKEKAKARRQKSIYSMVNLSGNQKTQKPKQAKSKIPVPNRYIPPTHHQGDDGKVALARNNCPEDIGPHLRFESHRQRARNVPKRSRVNAAFDSLFRHYCDEKYRGNIIDGPSHCRWMRETGVHMDEDGNGFRKYAKGKLDLNITEYKCAIKKMCDEAGTNYWDILEKMTSLKDAESNSTKFGT